MGIAALRLLLLPFMQMLKLAVCCGVVYMVSLCFKTSIFRDCFILRCGFGVLSIGAATSKATAVDCAKYTRFPGLSLFPSEGRDDEVTWKRLDEGSSGTEYQTVLAKRQLFIMGFFRCVVRD